MRRTLDLLDREWAALTRSPAAAQALVRWSRIEPALGALGSLDDVLRGRIDEGEATAVLGALAKLAPQDTLAARCLLHALLPGLVRLASTACADDPDAFDELLSIAWVRVRTYPSARLGSVAANVLWDVRKRYRNQHPTREVADGLEHRTRSDTSASAETVALADVGPADELHSACRAGVITPLARDLIIRTRLEEVPLDEAAAEHDTTVAKATCVRWRAERRLRSALAEAC